MAEIIFKTIPSTPEKFQISAFAKNNIIAGATLIEEESGYTIQQIFVEKDWRSNGIGSEILIYLEDYVWLNKKKCIYAVPNDTVFYFLIKMDMNMMEIFLKKVAYHSSKYLKTSKIDTFKQMNTSQKLHYVSFIDLF